MALLALLALLYSSEHNYKIMTQAQTFLQLKNQNDFMESFDISKRTSSTLKPFVCALPPFSLLRDFSFQNTSDHFAIRFRQSYLIWEVCDVTAIELSSKE